MFIAEDDGSPDADFPCLDPKEIVGKFGFTSLAMVRATNVAKEPKKETGNSTGAGMEPQISEEKSSSVEPQQASAGAVLESTDFHAFKGFLLHKVRPKTEVTLGKILLILNFNRKKKLNLKDCYHKSLVISLQTDFFSY